jgi:hypothetical protein
MPKNVKFTMVMADSHFQESSIERPFTISLARCLSLFITTKGKEAESYGFRRAVWTLL